MMMTIQEKYRDNFQIEHMFLNQCHEAELVRDYGGNSLSFFGLAPENRHFLALDGAGLVNYRLVENVAVVLGDPVCAPEAREQVTRSFLSFCARQCWFAAFYQASAEYLPVYRGLKLHAFKIGEEAILHPQAFTLNGSALANVRTSCRRAEREGVRIQWYEGVPSVEVMKRLEHVSHSWLERKAGTPSETGFSTGRLDEVTAAAERAEALANGSPRAAARFVTAVAETSAGEACAFVTFTPIYGSLTIQETAADPCSEKKGWGWSLDLMRRIPDAPPGVMELLLVCSLERFRLCGAHVVSLGLAALTDTRQEMTSMERQLASFATDRLHLVERCRTLFNFKQKFHPCWESRYLVTSTSLALPKIALAIFRLRNYAGGKLAKLEHHAHRWHGWNATFRQFLRYCVVGGTNTLFDVLMLNALLWRVPTNNAQALVAYNSLAYSCGALTSFFLNKYWTFGHRQPATGREVARFAIILTFEILYSNVLIWLAGKTLQPLIANPTLWGNACKLVAISIGAVLSYTCMRFWTFAGGMRRTWPDNSE